ncbi:hypothetical protein [Cellulophaga algicola]|nr:hypothetical protein [Cellulophaga algicola]
MKKVNIDKSILKSKINKARTLKECFMNCEEKAIEAHSLQKNGALLLLEEEKNSNSSIYTLTETEIDLNDELNFIPVGKKNTSTFFGFCSTHDTQIFKEIENDTTLIDLKNSKHLFLLCFRAFAISHHRKKEDVHLFSTNEKDTIDSIKEYGDLNEVGIEKYLKGSKLAVEDMNPQKSLLIENLLNESYNCLEYFTYEVDYQIKFSSTMVTSPPFLFNGTEINIDEDPNFEYSDIISTIIPLDKRSLVILASFKDKPNGLEYLNELRKFEKDEKEKAITWHFLTNTENVIFSPLWMDNLPESRRLILKLYEDSKNQETEYLKYDTKSFNLNLFELSKT